MLVEPRKFIDTVAGYARQQTDNSADKPIRLAVVNPAYVSGAARVTFEGEDTLSDKAYASMEGYTPRASDRVVMVPVGNTYLIIGTVDSASDVGAWKDVSFDPDWKNYATNQEVVQYRRTSDGMGELKGLLNPVLTSAINVPTGSANPFFTLPVGYRPALESIFNLVSNGGAYEVRVIVSGVVYPQRLITGTASTYASTSWISLAGVRYKLA